MSVDDGEEEFTRVALLPPGGMDVETKKRILAAQRKTPRYLFRGWCNAKGNASGGYPKLNTANGITLRAFCFDGLSHTATPYDLSNHEFRTLTSKHLNRRPWSTQFSSWASSLQVAIFFGARTLWNVCSKCHISIVDTKMLKTQNVFVHVPSIAWLNPNYTGYPHEYLAHGVISGPAHKAIPLSAFNDIGLPFDENSGHDLWIRPSVHRLHEYHAPISISEVQNALNVAKVYGGDFVAPVMAAILTLKKRDS
jgi:hypothetical protein